MSSGELIIWLVVAAALTFDFTNGFHDGGSTRSVAVDVRVRNPDDLESVSSAVTALPEVDRCAVRRTPDYRNVST